MLPWTPYYERVRKLKSEEVCLETLYALEGASEKFLRSAGRPNISFDLGDWSVGKTCRNVFADAPDKSTTSELIRDSCRLEYIVQLSKALMTSASELLDLHERKLGQLSLNFSRDIESLPNELLATIFHFAIQHGQNEAQDALRLSHVSRKFREVCLEDKRLWSTIRLRGHSIREFAQTCISRSGQERDLQIVLVCDDSSVAQDFAETLSPSITRWRSLTLTKDGGGDGGGNGDYNIGDALEKIMQKSGLILPRLQKLTLCQHRWPITGNVEPFWWESSENDFQDVCPWETPSLRVLRCIHYIPPSTFPFTSFTTFSLSLMLVYGYEKQAENLREFLARQPNITTMELELESFDGMYEVEEDEVANAVLPTMTSFQLKIRDFNVFMPERYIPRPFWSILQMPNLESLSLVIDGFHGWDPVHLNQKRSTSEVFIAEIDTLFPHPDESLCLSSLTITMLSPSTETIMKEPRWRGESLILHIPLDKIPRVTKLAITTFCQVSFGCAHPRSNDSNISMGPSRLRELKFYSCEIFNIQSLRKVVQTLKEIGAWETMERVILRNCKSLDFESALGVIGKERLRFEA